MPRPLTNDEQARFQTLIDMLAGRFPNAEPALMNVRLDGREVAVVVAVSQPDDENYRVDPLAVLVDDDLLRRLDPGDGVEIAGDAA